ncbi:MAG: NAD-dependent epimerase/dehydratase family protein [Negativicutes bacterium]|jgi:dTDP-glucose 4,6-dehydratase
MIFSAEKIVRSDCEAVLKNNIEQLAELRNSCIIITGGTGFVGTWLCELLTTLNDVYSFNIHIWVLARTKARFEQSAAHLLGRKDIKYISKNVVGVTELPVNLDYIIHAASIPDNREHSSQPLNSAHVITQGTEAVLSAASRLSGLRKILNLSSGHVYGAQAALVAEDGVGAPDCNSANAVYAESKRYAEMLCAIYRAKYRLPIVTARPFALMGPYQPLDRPWAVNSFLREGLLGQVIRILGDGETRRSYLYGSDMAFWLLKILLSGEIGAAYNVGSDHSIKLLDLAKAISENCDGAPPLVCGLHKSSVKSCFVPNIHKASAELGLKVTVDINEAIDRTINWHKTSTSLSADCKR